MLKRARNCSNAYNIKGYMAIKFSTNILLHCFSCFNYMDDTVICLVWWCHEADSTCFICDFLVLREVQSLRKCSVVSGSPNAVLATSTWLMAHLVMPLREEPRIANVPRPLALNGPKRERCLCVYQYKNLSFNSSSFFFFVSRHHGKTLLDN
ncbi:hypothetical protein HPP92_009454, partial [Vanilla planifolia]